MTTGKDPGIGDRIRNLSPEKRAQLEQMLAGRDADRTIRQIPRRNAEECCPLSFGQQRLWFLDQFQSGLAGNSGLAAFNVLYAVRLTGELNRLALQDSLTEIVRRHESLRTTFIQSSTGPVQVVQPAMTQGLPLCDLSDLGQAEATAEAERLIEGQVQCRFDLASDPLLRALLLQFGRHEHVFVLTIHHIATDAWSWSVLWAELSSLYAARSAGQPPLLPDLPIQYADYAKWQRNRLDQPAMARQIDYWERQLAFLPTVLDLPADRSRPAIQSDRCHRLGFALPRSLSQSLTRLARSERSTLYMVLLSAFQTLLHRYTGQTDIAVGSPTSGRTHSETEALIGFFINTLVMRVDLSGEPTFRELLRRVRKVALEAYEHQDVPFEKVVEVLAPERNMSHQPLVQVAFGLQNLPPRIGTLAGLEVELLEIAHASTKFDLWISLDELPAGLSGRVEFNADLFDTTTVQRMLGHFQTLLEAIVARPDERIAMLSILTDPERKQLQTDWNSTTTDVPRDVCIHHLFEEQVARSPAAIAVECAGKAWSYKVLNERANRIAHTLRQRGIGADCLVAVCLDRSLDMVASLLGVLKAGGAYVPLDPNYPPSRLASILADSQPAVVLTESSVVSRLTKLGTSIVCLDADGRQFDRESSENLETAGTDRDLAYVIYTSGSTGAPKGVAIEHRSLTNVVLSMRRQPGIGPGDIWLAITTVSFDIAALELFLPLIIGAKLVIATREAALDGRLLAAMLQQSRATILQATPATWRMLVDVGWRQTGGLTGLCGGEALPGELAAELVRRKVSLWNVYGPTETTIWSTIHRVDAGEVEQIGLRPVVSIGGPIDNTRLYVLDASQQLLPVGVPGELHIGGTGLARGYWNRPELTALKFVSAPFLPASQGLLYRTGDWVRWRSDGTIEFMGRRDHQVKIRGHRVELGEIEAALQSHGGIKQCVVVARDEDGDRRLIGYVVLSDAAVVLSSVTQYLKERLPSFMVPSQFVSLDALPLTPNGKIDRHRLPAPETGRAPSESGEPRDPLEFQLMRIWEEVLKVRQIGIRDNFFELGGHSLLAVKLFDRVERATGVQLPLVTLFECPTIEHLAVALRERHTVRPRKTLVAIQPSGSKPPVFLIPPAGGSVLRFAELARHLGSDQPVFGLEPPGRDEGETPLARVEEMASHYLGEIRRLQPTGPYLIAGLCFGGFVAWEMAQQLSVEGDDATVMLIDCTIPRYGPSWEPQLRDRRYFQQRIVHDLISGKLLRSVCNSLYQRLSRLDRIRYWWTARGRRHLRLLDVHFKANQTYTVSARSGRVMYVQSEEFSKRRFLHERWSELTNGDLEHAVVAGATHYELVLASRFAPVLAGLIREFLQRVDAESVSTEPATIPIRQIPDLEAAESGRAA